MFGVVRHYHFDKKNSVEIDRVIREGFVPLIKKAKGFVRYYWIDTGEGEGASFGVFTDKAGADESVRLAADFPRDHPACPIGSDRALDVALITAPEARDPSLLRKLSAVAGRVLSA